MNAPAAHYTAQITQENDNQELVHHLFRFRKTLFVDLLCWDLRSEDGLERDEFDRPDTLHVALHRNGTLVGGFRALRADRPYLASEVFPELAVTRSYPRQSDVWEISRFGILPLDDPRARLEAARVNYATMIRFAQSRNARSLVAIADVTYERFLSKLGIRTRRYGPPRPTGRDAAGQPRELLAGEIPLADQSGVRFQRLLDLAQTVEIIDEAHVLGRHAIPA
ncbi:acyl-homoserine-lactone synthase [Stappia sp.]|uniref:acyl-homoserine-lactone synthase n=1 Tax=Stappia sp. TaxID=1870903 RepID=UPI0032D99A93